MKVQLQQYELCCVDVLVADKKTFHIKGQTDSVGTSTNEPVSFILNFVCLWGENPLTVCLHCKLTDRGAVSFVLFLIRDSSVCVSYLLLLSPLFVIHGHN